MVTGHLEMCCHHPSKGSLGMLHVNICRYTLWWHFLGHMYTQDNDNGKFWKEDSKKAFPAFRSVYTVIGSTTICPEMSVPSIVNVNMLWGFSLGQKLTSLKAGHCLEQHYIECQRNHMRKFDRSSWPQEGFDDWNASVMTLHHSPS